MVPFKMEPAKMGMANVMQAKERGGDANMVLAEVMWPRWNM
jgi:hypothetical protein